MNKFVIAPLAIVSTALVTTVGVVAINNSSAPTISLIGDEVVTHFLGTNYEDQGCNYSDKQDSIEELNYEVIQDLDTLELGIQEVIYQVTDTDGNSSSVSRHVVVQVDPRIGNLISLEGESVEVLNVDSTEYVDKGYVLRDNFHGITEDKISVEHNVDLSTRGTYKVSYYFVHNEHKYLLDERNVLVLPTEEKLNYLKLHQAKINLEYAYNRDYRVETRYDYKKNHNLGSYSYDADYEGLNSHSRTYDHSGVYGSGKNEVIQTYVYNDSYHNFDYNIKNFNDNGIKTRDFTGTRQLNLNSNEKRNLTHEKIKIYMLDYDETNNSFSLKPEYQMEVISRLNFYNVYNEASVVVDLDNSNRITSIKIDLTSSYNSNFYKEHTDYFYDEAPSVSL